MTDCLVVQHVVPESAFAIEDALRHSGVNVDTRRVYADDAIPPDLTGFDGLVVMGGPMSAGLDEGFPTRGAEIALLAGAIATGIPTLGVCLGAQLLALAGGGSVSVGSVGPEIGWSHVSVSAECRDDALFAELPRTMTVLQWHEDTFEIPPGGRRLMRGSRYDNQAFRVGDAAWGVQFHLEVTEEAVDGFLSAFGTNAESVPGGPEHIRRTTPMALEELAAARDLVFGRFADLVRARSG
jgi:GMP synthase-like glutamine amidotransferase